MGFDIDSALKEIQIYERIRALIPTDQWLRYYLSVCIVGYFHDFSFLTESYKNCNLYDALRLYAERIVLMNKTLEGPNVITICANTSYEVKTEEHFILRFGGANV